MNYRLCKPGVRLRDWVDDNWPNRDRASDGWIGDVAHQARPSDHNPDALGIVRAIDIDADLKPGTKDRSEAHRLVDTLRAQARQGTRPIAYIIWAGKIASPRSLWRWRPYTGTNPHMHHIHVSFRKVPNE